MGNCPGLLLLLLPGFSPCGHRGLQARPPSQEMRAQYEHGEQTQRLSPAQWD